MGENLREQFESKPYLWRMSSKRLAIVLRTDLDTILEFRSKNKPSTCNGIRKANPKKEIEGLKILIFDIETSPLKAYIWKLWKENIYLDQIISEWFMISWSAKWLHGDMYSEVLTPEEILKEDDSRITKKLWHLFNEADIVIAHNAKKFDVPRMNSRFILNNLNPPSFYRIIDTKEVSSKVFGFSSNKLDALAGYFNLEHKIDTDFELWDKCLQGDAEALAYMQKYNIYDTELLEQVYLKLRPWIPSHPNVNVYKSDCHRCSYCGNDKLSEEGFYYTNSNKYQVYRCSCGAISRSRIGSIKSKKTLAPIPK